MTPRIRTIVVAGVAFLLGGAGGIVAGVYVAIHFTSNFFADGFMAGQALETQVSVAVLRKLRANENQKAIDLLETRLDGYIIGLRTDRGYPDGTNESVRQAISRARDYRAEYPRKSGLPEADAAVNAVLNPGRDGGGGRP